MAEKTLHPAPSLTRAPALTLPEAESAAVRAAYGAAGVILEYGSGGSTAFAGSLPGKVLFSVESDRDWLDGLTEWFSAHPPVSDLRLHHADIGPTGAWGSPRGQSGWARYHTYPLSVWDREDFLHPDLILIDGRFRAACFLAALFRITRPVVVLWDDYADRPAYHEVERYARPVQMHGRMARFDLKPMAMPPADLAFVIDQFTRKQ